MKNNLPVVEWRGTRPAAEDLLLPANSRLLLGFASAFFAFVSGA